MAVADGDQGVAVKNGVQLALLFHRQPLRFGQVLVQLVEVAIAKTHPLVAVWKMLKAAPVQQKIGHVLPNAALAAACFGVAGPALAPRHDLGLRPLVHLKVDVLSDLHEQSFPHPAWLQDDLAGDMRRVAEE